MIRMTSLYTSFNYLSVSAWSFHFIIERVPVVETQQVQSHPKSHKFLLRIPFGLCSLRCWEEQKNKINFPLRTAREEKKSCSRWWWSGCWGIIVTLPVVFRIVRVKFNFLQRWLKKVAQSEWKKKKIVWRWKVSRKHNDDDPFQKKNQQRSMFWHRSV